MFEMKIGSSIVAVEDTNEMQTYIDSGKATPQTPVRQIGDQKWAKLEQVEGLHFPAPKVIPKEVVQPIPVPKVVAPRPEPQQATRTPSVKNFKFDRVHIALASCVALLVVVLAVSLIKSDPKTSFERKIVAVMKARMEEVCSQPSSGVQVTLDKITYDVIKNNSEVTPFIGRLDVRVSATDSKDSCSSTRSYGFAYRDGV